MNPSFSSDWSREEKEEYATKRMNEMKLKNEKFKQRHAEVEKDRLEAEKKCSAVTSGAKILPKTPDTIEEKPTFQRESRKQREWDIGKSANEGDWYPSAQQDYPSQEYHDSRTWQNESDRYPPAQQDYHRSQDYHHSRPPRRGGFYDKRRERQDGPWRSRGSRPFPSRGSSRYRGSNQSRPTGFQSGNVSNYSRESNKNSFKPSAESSFKNSSNWNDSKRNAYYSNNAFPKSAAKSDNDKMWHDDGINEVQNKQSRVEKWVKSINKVEDWGEGEERPSKNYKNVGTGRNSGNYQDREQKSWHNEGYVDPNAKKHSTQNKTKYDKPYEHSYNKNVSTYEDKLPHTSDPDHRGFVGRKTSYGHKRDNNLKYNHGVSSYDKIETSNFKNDTKIRKQSRYSKDSGADIWDDENEDESNNKFSGSKTEFHGSKHGFPDKNRDSRSAAWDYKEADNLDSKNRSEVRKKEYSRKKDIESDIWNDCDQTNDWGTKLDTKSGSETKEQAGEGTNVSWDCNYGDDWNNKVVNSEIESNVKLHSNSESIGWDHEKKDDLKAESKTEKYEDCDISNDFENILADKEVLTCEKNDHDENIEYEEENIYDAKEMVPGLNNLENNFEDSISEYKTNDSNEISYSDSRDSEFISNAKHELSVSEVTEYDCDNKSKDSDSAEQNLKNSKYSEGELDDSEAKVEVQECDYNTDSNEPENLLGHENIGKMKEVNDSKSELIMIEEISNLSINEDSTCSKPTLSDSQVGISVENSITLNQSLSHESNEMNKENNHCFEMDKTVDLKDESNLSCVIEELSTSNCNNSVISHSKLNESNELLQQSICIVENQDSQFSSENQDKSISSFPEISSENVSCDIINKSSPVLSQGSIQDDDDLSSQINIDATESTKR